MTVYVLSTEHVFPDPRKSRRDGRVAGGGDLHPERVLEAYQHGIFPWPVGRTLAWFCPDPRMVLEPGRVHVSKSLRKVLRDGTFDVTLDEAFDDVIRNCAQTPRDHESGTWITDEIIDTYGALHDAGHAHSVEVWQGGRLVGGLYGISQGRVFCGESMFHHVSDASKAAFVTLARQLDAWGFDMVDCQLPTPHLASLGAQPMPRARFLDRLGAAIAGPGRRGRGTLDADLEVAPAGG